MRRNFSRPCLVACVLMACALLVPVAPLLSQDASNDVIFQPSSLRSDLSLIEGEGRRVQLPDRIKSVEGYDENLLKVMIVPGVANQVRVTATAPGVTKLQLKDEFDRFYSIDVTIAGDTRQLESLIKKAFPEANVEAVKVKDAVLLTGWVNQQDQLTPIVSIAEQFFPKVLNYLKVGGVQQVMLRVKIMEVQRSKIRKFGFNFLHLDNHGYVHSLPGTLAPLAGSSSSSPLSLPFGGNPAAGVATSGFNGSALTFGLTASQFVFNGFLEALKEERLLKILAEPNLVTVNGRQANFLSGGEFPIPVPQSLGTVTIQWREFGVKLAFVPYVLGAGRLRLDVAPEISDQDPGTGITLNGTTVNGLSTRKVETQVEMNFGQTLLIAGLINNRTRGGTHKIPFLGELPWIGAAFRRVTEDVAETELLVMVTPELVSALDPEQVSPHFPGSTTTNPTDKELFGLGLLEVPNYGPECPDCEVPQNGMIYPNAAPLTPQAAEPYQAPVSAPPALNRNGNYNEDFDSQGIEVPAPPAGEAGAKPQTSAGRSRISTTPNYLSNRNRGSTSSRVQPAGVGDRNQLDPRVQQSGYSAPQSNGTTSRRGTRPGMIAP